MWNQTDNGDTIGTIGSEIGEIIKDEEHSKGARLTLEKGGDIAPYSITSGCFFHTTYLSTLEEGVSELDAMKAEISEFFDTETTGNEEHDWIVAFVGKH
jgi:uncharacterized protein YprB with RNaseH-like and TPR domain